MLMLTLMMMMMTVRRAGKDYAGNVLAAYNCTCDETLRGALRNYAIIILFIREKKKR